MGLPTRQEVENLLQPLLDNLPVDKHPLVAFAIRGYNLDMGKKGVNDRGEWDDVNGWLERTGEKEFHAFEGNADPTAAYRYKLGSVHAPQACPMKIGKHKGRDAFRQNGTFHVERDGIGLVLAGIECGFNWHDSITKAQTTSSLGCQTNKKEVFKKVRSVGYRLVRKHYKNEEFLLLIVDMQARQATNPVPAAKAMPRSLVKGMRGSEVHALQELLGIPADGIFGDITEKAVMDFQKKHGLVVDGKAGPKTMAKLKAMSLVKDLPKKGLDGLKKGTSAWYEEAFRIMGYDPGYEKLIQAGAKRVLSGKARYQKVADAIGCPWWVVGVIHSMEASCDFAGVLHNGERIIGKGVKTKLVPAGRGPFKTWEAAAIDALTLKGFDKIRDWSVGNSFRLLEMYNGTGYLKYHQEENSPYLWSMTTINDNFGKYVADGKWDANANANGQVGIAALLKELSVLGAVEV